MKTLFLAALLFQAVQPPVPAPVPKLTATETIALQEVTNEYNQVMQRFTEINSDISKNHPGYHLDPSAPLSGKLVQDTPRENTPKVPEKVQPPAKDKIDESKLKK